MRIPKRMQRLVEEGLIDEVVRPLLSGKEASVYVVVFRGELRCAKVYKEATERTFRQRIQYQEGRSVRNTRRARAMDKRTKYGRRELEDAWQTAEVDALYRLAGAGVRVPKPSMYDSGVLVMELVQDADGHPAPRLGECAFTEQEARELHAALLREVIRMLCAGIVHGDLSEYNILLGAEGPVIIDLPQAVNAAGNNAARGIFERDVGNLATFFGRFVPELRSSQYGVEIWKLYEAGKLTPESELTGVVAAPEGQADVEAVLSDIADAREEAERRLGRMVVDVPMSARRKAALADAAARSKTDPADRGGGAGGRSRRRRRGGAGAAKSAGSGGGGSVPKSRGSDAGSDSRGGARSGGTSSGSGGGGRRSRSDGPPRGRSASAPARDSKAGQAPEASAQGEQAAAPKKRRRRRRRRRPESEGGTPPPAKSD